LRHQSFDERDRLSQTASWIGTPAQARPPCSRMPSCRDVAGPRIQRVPMRWATPLLRVAEPVPSLTPSRCRSGRGPRVILVHTKAPRTHRQHDADRWQHSLASAGGRAHSRRLACETRLDSRSWVSRRYQLIGPTHVPLPLTPSRTTQDSGYGLCARVSIDRATAAIKCSWPQASRSSHVHRHCQHVPLSPPHTLCTARWRAAPT